MEDMQIIQLLFQRSERALRELEEKYGERLRALAFQLLGCSQDAEECVNDAYLGAWNAIPPARPDCLLGYLCKIVRNLAIKRWNRNGAEKRNGGYQVALQELEEWSGRGPAAWRRKRRPGNWQACWRPFWIRSAGKTG